MKKKYDTKKFIKESKKIHKNRLVPYNYSLTIYINIKSKIKIIYSEHGEFEQSTEKHLMGREGCKECSKRKYFVSNEEAEERIKKFYDYELIEIKEDSMIMKCKEHGIFEMTRRECLGGYGACRVCKVISTNL